MIPQQQVYSYFFSSAMHILFTLLGQEVSGHAAAVLLGATSRVCSKQHAAASLSSYHIVVIFSLSILLEFKLCNDTPKILEEFPFYAFLPTTLSFMIMNFIHFYKQYNLQIKFVSSFIRKNTICKQHSIKQQLYNHLPPISQIIQVKWTRHAKHSSRSKDKLMSDVLSWSPP